MTTLEDVSYNALEVAPPIGIGAVGSYSTVSAAVPGSVFEVRLVNGLFRTAISPNAPIYGLPLVSQGKAISLVFYTATQLEIGQPVVFDLQASEAGYLFPANIQF